WGCAPRTPALLRKAGDTPSAALPECRPSLRSDPVGPLRSPTQRPFRLRLQNRQDPLQRAGLATGSLA
ncbi:hypothetical protein, partial [Streptomyces sp. NPDC047525]|uniref:hypothetical protein n=1 Tax=Streptomyces sp. NPDC047525 TaxID=3155264 RepID=UPI0033F40F3D